MPSDVVTLAMERSEIEKGGYKHFMIKEIHDQPRVMKECLRGRVVKDEGKPFDIHLGALCSKVEHHIRNSTLTGDVFACRCLE